MTSPDIVSAQLICARRICQLSCLRRISWAGEGRAHSERRTANDFNWPASGCARRLAVKGCWSIAGSARACSSRRRLEADERTNWTPCAMDARSTRIRELALSFFDTSPVALLRHAHHAASLRLIQLDYVDLTADMIEIIRQVHAATRPTVRLCIRDWDATPAVVQEVVTIDPKRITCEVWDPDDEYDK